MVIEYSVTCLLTSNKLYMHFIGHGDRETKGRPEFEKQTKMPHIWEKSPSHARKTPVAANANWSGALVLAQL